MATNDPSKTMFGISPFNARDEGDAEEAAPESPTETPAVAVASMKRSLFFDEDGWDVPEERMSGAHAVARERTTHDPLAVSESLGLTDAASAPVALDEERPFSGTIRLRADDLAQEGSGDDPGPTSLRSDTEESASDEPGPRPFTGTMMFSAQDIVGALDAEQGEESIDSRPYEQEVRRATTQETRGIEAESKETERTSSGTMRFRPEELAAMDDGSRPTTEFDLRGLAHTTGSADAVAADAADSADSDSSEPDVSDSDESTTDAKEMVAPDADPGADGDAGADVAASPIAAADTEDKPAKRAPAVTRPTQLMPAMTLPSTIPGEADALLGAAEPASPATTEEPSSQTSMALVAVVVLIVLVVLVIAAMVLLK